MMRKVISDLPKETELIILAQQEQKDEILEYLPAVSDLWTLPMQEEELKYRILKWQMACKKAREEWEMSQFLEAAINGMPHLVWFKDKDGIHQKVNDSFCRTVNKPKKLVEGRDHYFIWDVDPNDPGNEGHDCADSEREVFETRQMCISEEMVKTGEGMKLLTTYKSPLYDLDGSVMGTVGIGVDITQERAYEHELVKKNRTLETIFSYIDCGVLCHSLDGNRLIRVNQAALRILGYETQEEMEEDGFHMVAQSVMDEDKPKIRACIQELKNVGDSVSIEYRVEHPNGEIIHVMGNVKLLRENGELYYQRFLLDCTSQKQEEKKNRHRQMELMRALSVDYNLVCYFDLDTEMGMLLRVKDDSQSFAEAFSGDLIFDDCMENYISRYVVEEDRKILRETIRPERIKKELSGKKLFCMNYRAISGNDIDYYEMKVVRTGSWKDGKRIVIGFRSVDEQIRREMEQKELLEDALVQVNRASQAKGIFLSNMSHDIRTPMNAIMGFTNLASVHLDDQGRVKEYLEKIQVSGNYLLSLINNVLDMSQIESGNMCLEETLCSLPEILKNLNDMMQIEAEKKLLQLRMHLTGVDDKRIYCDRMRLSQILLNVVENSLKYTRPGGRIDLDVVRQKGTAPGFVNYDFCVKDSGIGMSPEFLEHVFDLFEREKNTTISGVGGTGLGLALTKSLVEMMNGKIEVESEPEHGTTVRISLTFRVEKEEDEIWKESVEKQEESEHYAGRILLVEDNELNMEIAQTILEDVGFETESAENGQIAVDMVKRSPRGYYELVLMDIQMPVMNGYEAAKAIRSLEDPELASIPIIAMTANAFEEDREKALRSGMDDHLAKPIDVKLLLEMMDLVRKKKGSKFYNENK
ncbi:ATP-binding protein [Roseburia hominis]